MSQPGPRVCLLVALFYGALAVVLLAPSLAVGDFVGHPDSDLWKHVWGHWWVGTSLHQQLAWPLETRLQGFPWGGTLFVIDPFNALVCGAMQGLLPAPLAFNLLVVGQLTLGAWAAWRLACEVTDNPAASLVSGAIYGFSPWAVAYAVGSGVSETLGLGWIPLAMLLTLRSLPAGATRSALWAGVALLIAGLNSWYYLLFAMVGCALLVVASLLWGRPGSWLPLPGRGWLGRLLLAVLLAVVGLLPLAAQFTASFDPSTSLEPAVEERMLFTTGLDRQMDFFTVSDFFVPGKDRLRVSEVLEWLAQTPYLGLTGLALALVGICRSGRSAAPWTAGAILFFLLSLGPAVTFTPSLCSSQPVNAVYLLCFYLFGFWLITAPFRVHVLTLLCVAVLAAIGLASLRATRLGGVLATALVVAEVCWLSPAPFPVPSASAEIPGVVRALRLDARVGVLDIPAVRYETRLAPGKYFYNQTWHHAGIPYTTAGIVNGAFKDNGFFLEMWRLAAGIFPPAADPMAAGRGLDDLSRLGYRHVLLHTDALSPATAGYARRVLERWLGPPTSASPGILHYRLEPLPEAE